ncbi:MAG: FkbM family methyltransferase [Fimbriimonadaceae bacterium]|nr:FkbM family methyltransferase [Fimbriimonadaceae bacterium]
MRLRTFLRPILKHVFAPIPAGPNQGLICSKACGAPYRKGTYEAARWEPLAGLVEPGDVFWDVGAHYGYVTLLAHRAVGPAGQVYAFEPSRKNRSFLKGHVRANRAANVEVLPWAFSDTVGKSRFGGGTGSGTRQLGTGRTYVQTHTVDALVASGRCKPPTWLKLDVEGAEVAVLRGAERALRSQPAATLVATHSPTLHADCLNLLEGFGLRCHVPERSQIALAGGVSRMETEILAISPTRAVPEALLTAFLQAGL